MTQSYALQLSDIEKVIRGIDETFKGKEVISAHLVDDETGRKTFIYKIGKIGRIIFAADEEGIFQLLEIEGDQKSMLCIGLNLHMQKHTGKDWPSEL